MNITVLGCGRWASLIAWYNCKIGNEVMMYGRKQSKRLQTLRDNRQNEYLTLQDSIKLTDSLQEAVSFAEVIVISISSQNLRELANNLQNFDLQKKKFVLAMKGLEKKSGKRLSVVFAEETQAIPKIATWLGPGHVQDFLNNIPNCMVITSEDEETTKSLVEIFNSDLIRFYYGSDMIGNEIGAAAKNVIGVAAGMLDGLGISSLKGALMARGTREISRLIKAAGGDELTAYGLAHLGDYQATLFSEYSNNRRFGENFILAKKSKKLAEGVSTILAIRKLGEQLDVDVPITNALYEIIYEKKTPKDVLDNLFLRSTKFEF